MGEYPRPARHKRTLVHRQRGPARDLARRQPRRRLQGSLSRRGHQFRLGLSATIARSRSSAAPLRWPKPMNISRALTIGASTACDVDRLGKLSSIAGPGNMTRRPRLLHRALRARAANTASMSSSICIKTSGAACRAATARRAGRSRRSDSTSRNSTQPCRPCDAIQIRLCARRDGRKTAIRR